MLKSKVELIQNVVNTKLALEHRFIGAISDADFAYQMAQDEDMRKTALNLTQKVLQPTPLKHLKVDRTNLYIDVGMGVSAFWDEIRTKTKLEVETASNVENILMNVEAGMDKDMEPNTRKMFLSEVGLNEEQIDELVPISDYVMYDEKIKDIKRERVIDQYNLGEGDEDLIESLVADQAMDDEIADAYESSASYDDIYGMSASDMYNAFPQDDYHDVDISEHFTEDTPNYLQYPIDELNRIYSDTMTNNMAELVRTVHYADVAKTESDNQSDWQTTLAELKEYATENDGLLQ